MRDKQRTKNHSPHEGYYTELVSSRWIVRLFKQLAFDCMHAGPDIFSYCGEPDSKESTTESKHKSEMRLK